MKSCISTIRELISTGILQSLLLTDRQKWHLMCGSLDALESAQMAVDSYIEFNENPKIDFGLESLLVYGFFQALYVQQDAVCHLQESLGVISRGDKAFWSREYPEINKIRQLRNKGIGHPSKQGNTNSSHSILTNGDSIKLFSYTETGEFSADQYKISECIQIQDQSLCKILQKVITKMRSMEKEHKDKYKQDKFRECFPGDPQYCFGKLFEAIEVPEKRYLALSETEELIEAIDKFDRKLKERDLQCSAIDYVRLEIESSKYPLGKLKEYFGDDSKKSFNSQDAQAYADSAKMHVSELIHHAESWDDTYESTA